jgi:hypothetical protein
MFLCLLVTTLIDVMLHVTLSVLLQRAKQHWHRSNSLLRVVPASDLYVVDCHYRVHMLHKKGRVGDLSFCCAMTVPRLHTWMCSLAPFTWRAVPAGGVHRLHTCPDYLHKLNLQELALLHRTWVGERHPLMAVSSLLM